MDDIFNAIDAELDRKVAAKQRAAVAQPPQAVK